MADDVRPRNGRAPGVPNRVSLDRVAKAAAEGPLPADALLYKMRYWLKIVGETQKLATAGAVTAADAHKTIAEALDKACDAAKDAAPYFHQRLAAIAIDHRVRYDLSRLTDDELNFLERIAERAVALLPGPDQGGEGSTTH